MDRVQIVDSIMGSGKTSWAIEYMKKRTDKHFLFVTPYLEEIDRIVAECPGFVQPIDKKGKWSKSYDLKTLLKEKRSIACTHALFERLNTDTVNLIHDDGNYCLILDEVMDVLKYQRQYKKAHIDELLKSKVLIAIDQDIPNFAEIKPGPTKEFPEYRFIRQQAKAGRIILVYDYILMWLFPAGIFDAFSEVWNLTYLFNGSHQRAYFDLYGVEYDKHTVWQKSPGVFSRIPYDPEKDSETIERARELINIYEGDLNYIGWKHSRSVKSNPLSYTWLKKHPGKRTDLSRCLYNYYRRAIDSTRESRIWTIFKKFKEHVENGRYKNNWVALNTRATNQYGDRSDLAYLINRFHNPEVMKYFELFGVAPDENQYALSEMIQWIWRSRIRNDKSINLYIPAKRMRDYLKDWLNLVDARALKSKHLNTTKKHGMLF